MTNNRCGSGLRTLSSSEKDCVCLYRVLQNSSQNRGGVSVDTTLVFVVGDRTLTLRRSAKAVCHPMSVQMSEHSGPRENPCSALSWFPICGEGMVAMCLVASPTLGGGRVVPTVPRGFQSPLSDRMWDRVASLFSQG